jgi:hypothetical protein
MKKKAPKKRKVLLVILGSVLLLLIGLRIALPYILLRLVNKELMTIPGYTGHVQDIDVALIRGAYKIKKLNLEKTGGQVPVPFVSAEQVDLSIEWSALFHGRIVGKILVQSPVLNFVQGPTEKTSQTGIDKKWTDVVKKLMPLKLNHFEINDGEIHFRNYHSSPKFDIFADHVHITAENLTNVDKSPNALPATAEATGNIYGGKAKIAMKLNPLNDNPTFELKATLQGSDIAQFNDFIEAFAKLDVKQGEISIYTEAATKDQRITGYVKPIIKDLRVVDWQKDKDKPLKIVYESAAGVVAWVFKNHPKDQLATKADFEGNFKNPNVDVWAVIGEVLENAFIQALSPALENSVNMNSVATKKNKPLTGLKKIFGKKKNENKKSA